MAGDLAYYILVTSDRQRNESRQCHVVLRTMKKNTAGRTYLRSGEGRRPRGGSGQPLWGSGQCARQQRRTFGETILTKADITPWPGGHMCPVRCQDLTSGQWVRKRAQAPKEQGCNCLLRVWPSESHVSLQRSVSSCVERVKYRIISSGCCGEKMILT